MAKSNIENPERSGATIQDALRALADADVLLQKVTRHLDLATDPELDLALEVVKLREKNKWLQVQVEGSRRNEEDAKQEVEDAKQEARLAQGRELDERRRRKQVEKDFEKMEFRSQVGAYLSDAALERNRR